MTDTSGHDDGVTLGLGCVVTTLTGRVLWEGQAWMQLRGASTELLECTPVLEGVRALVRWLQACSHTVGLLLVVCDNQTAAQALCHRAMLHRVGSLRDRVVANAIELDNYVVVVYA